MAEDRGRWALGRDILTTARFLRPAMGTCAVLLVLLSLVRMRVAWRNNAYLRHAVGTWIALAEDFRNGTFYRSLFSPLGYGGTRYFALHFVLHGELLKLGIDPRTAGHLIALISMPVLLVGTTLALKNLGCDWLFATCIAILILAPQTAQLAPSWIRGDTLAAALNICGLAACMRRTFSRWHLFAASLFFTLAFSAKVTTVFGVAAVIPAFLLSGRSKDARKLMGLTAAGMFLTLGIMYYASAGRVFEIMRTCMAAGGGLSRLAYGPITLIQVGMEEDPLSIFFLVLGLGALAVSSTEKLSELPALFLLATGLVTCAIYGSPGTAQNHLLDLEIASLIMFASGLLRFEKPEFGLSVITLAVLAALSWSVPALRHRDTLPRRQGFQEALQLIGASRRPILADNPLLPIIAEQRPYLPDAFLFNTLRERDVAFAEPLREAIQNQSFSAVVLEYDSCSGLGQRMCASVQFGGDFLQLITSHYQLAGRTAAGFVYLPRQKP